jgi:hypothetical protein
MFNVFKKKNNDYTKYTVDELLDAVRRKLILQELTFRKDDAHLLC